MNLLPVTSPLPLPLKLPCAGNELSDYWYVVRKSTVGLWSLPSAASGEWRLELHGSLLSSLQMCDGAPWIGLKHVLRVLTEAVSIPVCCLSSRSEKLTQLGWKMLGVQRLLTSAMLMSGHT